MTKEVEINDSCVLNGVRKGGKMNDDSWSSKASIIRTRVSSDTLVSFDDISSIPQTPKSSEKWNTGFWTQFKMLTWRSFKQSRGRFLHRYDIIFYAIVFAMAGGLYFQIKNNDYSIRDRMGLLFFYVTFWIYEANSQAIFAIPGERGVISKERSAGAYRLSAYYLAKTTSELPLQIIMPTLFYSFIFWIAGLGGVPEFCMTLSLLLLSTLTAQGMGLFIGCAFMDIKIAFLSGTTIILVGLLFSGFLTQTFPKWLTWAMYISIIKYPLSAMSIILFTDMENVPCNTTSVKTFPQCLHNGTDYLTPAEVLANAGIDIPIYCYISTMFILFIGFRIAAYVALRYRHRVPE